MLLIKPIFIAITTSLPLCFTVFPASAGNPEHLKQLINTNVCQGCDLSGVDLRNTNLSGADLSGANLSGADLSGVNLNRANLSNADLTNANLNGVNLKEANLTNVIGLSAGTVVPNEGTSNNTQNSAGSATPRNQHYTRPEPNAPQPTGSGGSR
ncbi:pentapeptide repeat-containing protein [Aerosakkonemataceae cyanobacterium BLCC-F154]|uniref:Pentapeptide repeat-containing protein n=1 Tax=Floridaenema fluviatile BLCC-F154 TaxID=3153640 RepID=A0ABV4YFE6_9CYAN